MPRPNARPPRSATWFDLIVVDEASQMDVASSLLVVSKLADGGALVLAGDDLQLPPIHQARAPLDLDGYVGSVFEFVRHVHGVRPCRSTSTTARTRHSSRSPARPATTPAC